MRKSETVPAGDAAADALVSAKEAVRLLGVKRETLYAYASRGLVRSVPGERGRAKQYWKSDLERLRARHDARSGHGAVAAGALRWGEPVLQTTISAIGPRGPHYAGHDAVELADRGVGFERTAELLWTRQLPEDEVRWPRVDAGAPRPLLEALIPRDTPVPTALMAMVAAIAARDLDRFGARPEAELVRGRALIRRLVVAVALARDPRSVSRVLDAPSTAVALAFALGIAPSAANRALLERALVLWADHELNASTFTARVAASAGADLYACVGAALATHSGTRHGGALARVEALVDSIGRPDRALAAIRERLQRGEAIEGFGHLLYPQGDPRAENLLAAVAKQAPRNPGVRTVLSLAEAMRPRGQHPSFDLATVAAARALGVGRGHAVAIFAIGRSAGWIAHALEQRTQAFLVRPRARYVGPGAAPGPG